MIHVKCNEGSYKLSVDKFFGQEIGQMLLRPVLILVLSGSANEVANK